MHFLGIMMLLTISAGAASDDGDQAEKAPAQAVEERPRPCSSEPYRQFDFWLGEWHVQNVKQPGPAGGGRNSITRDHDGCALHESYTSGAYSGSSINFYNGVTKKWHQTWIDNQGFALGLDGGFEKGSMVLSSDPRQKPINRITWTPNKDGSVRQLWETSSDGGATWTVAFDGLYTRHPTP